jgi:hypothetical protein
VQPLLVGVDYEIRIALASNNWSVVDEMWGVSSTNATAIKGVLPASTRVPGGGDKERRKNTQHISRALTVVEGFIQSKDSQKLGRLLLSEDESRIWITTHNAPAAQTQVKGEGKAKGGSKGTHNGGGVHGSVVPGLGNRIWRVS